MLEWAQYMPQVTAVRKGAELSPADDTLRFARLVARGEEVWVKRDVFSYAARCKFWPTTRTS